jgi:hypothetical protein
VRCVGFETKRNRGRLGWAVAAEKGGKLLGKARNCWRNIHTIHVAGAMAHERQTPPSTRAYWDERHAEQSIWTAW